MGVFSLIRRDQTAGATRSAMRDVRRRRGGSSDAVTRIAETFRDVGLDGRLTFVSADSVAKRASRGRKTTPQKAVKRIVRRHRRGVTVAGFLTGLGGFATLPILLPLNIAEFYLQATRMVGAIAKVRGYDLADDRVRTHVLATLLAEESGDVLDHVGLGPLTGVVARRVARKLPETQMSEVANAIGVRILRRAGQRSFRLFGKAIPGLGGIIGAWVDRSQLRKIATTSDRNFPQQAN